MLLQQREAAATAPRGSLAALPVADSYVVVAFAAVSVAAAVTHVLSAVPLVAAAADVFSINFR